MPFVLAEDDGSGQPNLSTDNSYYYSIAGNENYILAGGRTYVDALIMTGDSTASVITRIDLASHVHKWSRTFHISGSRNKSAAVTAMSI